MSKANVSASKFLSYILRHKPDAIGLSLDSEGWANIDELIRLANHSGTPLTLAQLFSIVEEDTKQRFSLSPDKTFIRAAQGHSLKSVRLNLTETLPPDRLFHGTAERFMDSILLNGLLPQQRQYVHLTDNPDTALETGRRYGKPVLLTVNSQKMIKDGHKFYQADNGVWLTVKVPNRYISIKESPRISDS
ncbi:RNA 2'-phosphotransferase [Psychrobacter pygoscelis]|uniref:RNA 2'-phosphotransferase n=1 Tax=Psychrobacter pygoscelis TaxID=2488563 RepID=UPI001040A30D|nr:RNA 2'-phosphotransferase [Psychrobacter pygoscelis]